MINIDSEKLAVEMINSIMAMDDLPVDVYNRCSTALVLLDCQEGEDFDEAVKNAYEYIQQDCDAMTRFLEETESQSGIGMV